MPCHADEVASYGDCPMRRRIVKGVVCLAGLALAAGHQPLALSRCQSRRVAASFCGSRPACSFACRSAGSD